MPQKHVGISFTKRHVCTLNSLHLKRELPEEAPFAASCRKFFYNFRKWTIVSRWNPRVKVYFRSNCALFKEKRRQLRSKKLRIVIHPLSRFAMIRETVICVLWLISFVIDPLSASFLADYITRTELHAYEGFLLALNVLFLVDIIIQFFIGFIIKKTKQIVLEPRAIAKHYLNTFFLYDFIPVLYGWICILLHAQWFKRLANLPDDLSIYMAIAPVYILRFVRLHTATRYFRNTLQFLKVRDSLIKCITLAMVVLILLHWWTCALYYFPVVSYFLGYPFAHSWVLRAILGTRRTLDNIYVECLLCTACHFFGAGKGNIDTENPIEQLVLSFILMCGLTTHIYITAIILQLFGTINVSETKYEELIYQLNEYMVTKKLPPVLRKRLLMYYEYRFQKQYFHENQILNSLSEHLRFEVLLYSCRNLITKVKIFQGAPKEVIGALVAMLKHEIYLPNDHIIKSDALNEHVYFISFGTVSVYLPNGKELFHLEDGHHFGEVSVVLHGFWDRFLASIIAVEITEVFYLDKRDFWYVVQAHPEIADSLEKSALAKLATFKNVSDNNEDGVDDTDILNELRKGHILEKGRRRI